MLVSTRICLIASTHLVAGYYAKRKIVATEIAGKYNLNIRTLNTTLIKLVKAGILRSQVGGIDRGYIFARDPKSVSIYDILVALDDQYKAEKCYDVIKDLDASYVESYSGCLIYSQSQIIAEKANELFAQVSIYDQYKNTIGATAPELQE